MIRITDKRDCVGCANCLHVCPRQCIQWIRDEEGFCYPVVEESKCIDCRQCNDVCPVETTPPDTQDIINTIAFGAYNKDIAVRMNSSSGGVFTAFAEDIIKRKGVVYGAALMENHRVKHIAIHTLDEISQLRGSKYVQSDIRTVFPGIPSELKTNIPVLFSGTPCQVKALFAFLGTRPKNLLTIEVICHGVPSPKVFERYMSEEKISHIFFRNKDRSWRHYDVIFTLNKGGTKRQRAAENPYMRGFLQNWFLRPSCSRCPAKSFTSGADLTLGDFWGGASIAPGLFDDKGTSLVIVHTKKGENAWQNISDRFHYAEVPLDIAAKGNRSIVQSATFPKDRGAFFKDLERSSVKAALIKYAGEKPIVTIKRHLLSIWNAGLDFALRLNNGFLIITDLFVSSLQKRPVVVGKEATLLKVLKDGCSVCRFGDGEMKLLRGGQTWFQESQPLLQQHLREILLNHNPTLLVCVPNVFGPLSDYTESDRRYWRLHIARNRKSWLRFMDRNQTYYLQRYVSSCYTTRLFNISVQFRTMAGMSGYRASPCEAGT